MAAVRKIKASYHSGKGYAKHNNHYPTKRDKGNIDHVRTPQNKIWTCMKGMTDVMDAERMLYEQTFMDELELQNAKYRKKGNYKNIRTMDEWMRAERHRSVEDILQIGNMECYIAPEDLWECYVQFTNWRDKKYGSNMILISAVMHVDEATPHIHERYVWYWTDEEGTKHTGMKKSMEQAGIELPDPDKPEGRYNYRKMTFDAECRAKWQDIVEEKLKQYQNVELDRNIDQQRKQNRIGHMGIDNWRAYQSALDRTRNRDYILRTELEDLEKKKAAVQDEQERLAKEAKRLKLDAQQQDADKASLAARMAEIRERENELEEKERTFSLRVDDAVKRRKAAAEKYGKIHEKLYGVPSKMYSRNI